MVQSRSWQPDRVKLQGSPARMVGNWWQTGEDSVGASARPTGLSQLRFSLLVIACHPCVMHQQTPSVKIGILDPRSDFSEAATTVRARPLEHLQPAQMGGTNWYLSTGRDPGINVKDCRRIPPEARIEKNRTVRRLLVGIKMDGSRTRDESDDRWVLHIHDSVP